MAEIIKKGDALESDTLLETDANINSDKDLKDEEE